MKNYPYLILLLMLFTACYSPERDCDRFKTGTFQFESYLNGEMITSTFVRNDSIEIDHFRGKTDTSSVRWINNCEYILKNLNPKNRAERQPIHMKILTTSKDSYTFEYGLVGESNKKKGEVKKLQD
ncbi:DNA topoisomerase IV [Antarcticibacterium sp. 1MA-6-2]|uniref:DNA topoisomerase IV n=1 Tax=Antarcticibacterium sp. 1MA-6-2 TaxID=2908210 RepID=UPI001F44E459|nr:DNA topoisomerase IV [Antarcticibacterium sp. 1MA-6-2]UJH91796.1 DNA topoisomerase IV [Antarcticibacterium sp. 1MA-6-2]